MGYDLFMSRVYQEIVDFISRGSTPSAVAAFEPSTTSRDRVRQLLEQRKSRSLSDDDEAELNHFLELEHIMRLAKAKARVLLP